MDDVDDFKNVKQYKDKYSRQAHGKYRLKHFR